LLDWISTRLYARRQHRELSSERRKILKETLGKRSEDRTGESEQAAD